MQIAQIHKDKNPDIRILYDALLETIDRHGLKLPLVTVIGTLELVKINLTITTNEINYEQR